MARDITIPYDLVVPRLGELLGTHTDAETRKRLRVNPNTWKTWKKRGMPLPALLKIARETGASMTMLTAKGQTHRAPEGHTLTTLDAATDLAATKKGAEPKARYGEAIPPEVLDAVEAQMPKVKAATAVAMRIAAHFGIDYMARTVTELQTLAFSARTRNTSRR